VRLDQLLEQYRSQILKGIDHLSYSYNKVNKLSVILESLSTEEMEVWEGFVASF
jgi:hypothetical protein